MNDDQLLRYSRHILLDEIGIEGQDRLLSARVLVIGAGGLGAPALMYLAAAGCGRITVVDPDVVDLTNLQRQVAHTTDRIGLPKVDSAATAMRALNPGVQIHSLQERARGDRLLALVRDADVVLDCTDNFGTRQDINSACFSAGVPLVSGAAIRFDAQVTVFDPRDALSPCYACLFPPDAAPEEIACSTMGVFAPLTGIVGAMQAAEALKLIAGVGRSLAGRLLMLDARDMRWTEFKVPRRAGCPVCGHRRALGLSADAA